MVAKHTSNAAVSACMLDIEDNLLVANLENPQSLASILQKLRVVQSAISDKALDTHTAQLLYSAAKTGLALLNVSSGVERITSEVEAKRRGQLDEVFSTLSISDDGDSPSQDVLNVGNAGQPYGSVRKAESSYHKEHPETSISPPHVHPSYSWLLDHIHDPYPSSSTTFRIASSAKVPYKTVRDWFVNIRRRIGWTSLVKRHFRGNRARAIEAARSVFLGRESNEFVNPIIQEEFAALRRKALALFNESSGMSHTVWQLDELIKDCRTAPSVSSPRRTVSRKRRTSGSESDTPTLIDSPGDDQPLEYSKIDASSACALIPSTSDEICRQAKDVNPELDSTSSATTIGPGPSNSRKRNLPDAEEDFDEPARKRVCSLPTTFNSPTTQPTKTESNIAEALDTPLCIDSLWSNFDFTMPSGLDVRTHLPEGDIDLRPFDFSTYLDPLLNQSEQNDTYEEVFSSLCFNPEDSSSTSLPWVINDQDSKSSWDPHTQQDCEQTNSGIESSEWLDSLYNPLQDSLLGSSRCPGGSESPLSASTTVDLLDNLDYTLPAFDSVGISSLSTWDLAVFNTNTMVSPSFDNSSPHSTSPRQAKLEQLEILRREKMRIEEEEARLELLLQADK